MVIQVRFFPKFIRNVGVKIREIVFKPKTRSESRIKRAKLGDLRLICHIVRFWSGVGGEMGASALVEKPSALASRATMSSAVDPP